MHKRERVVDHRADRHLSLLVRVAGHLLNVTPDRPASDLNKVFFTASHALFAMMIGYGLTLMAAYMATHYEKFRRWGFVGGGVAVVAGDLLPRERDGQTLFRPGRPDASLLAAVSSWDGWGYLAFGPDGQFGFPKFSIGSAQAFAKDQYGLPVFANLILLALPVIFIVALLVYRKRGPVLIMLALFAVMPLWSGLSHWYKSEQRNHWFGYWFGHDMFTPPFTDTETAN